MTQAQRTSQAASLHSRWFINGSYGPTHLRSAQFCSVSEVTDYLPMHSLFGLHFITTAMSPSSPAISNPPPLGVVRIDALSATLEQLGFGVQTDAILDAVKRLEEERDAKPTAPSAAAKRTAMVRLGQEIPPPSGRSTFSYTSTFVPKSSPV